MVELEIRERLVHEPADVLVEFLDPLDDPFSIQVKVGQLRLPDVEHATDVVGRLAAVAHGLVPGARNHG